MFFCAISMVPVKWFGHSFEMIFRYRLLLCGKLYAEHSWRSLNSCILSSVMSLERPLNVSQKTGNKVMGNEMYYPLHVAAGINPDCALRLSLFELELLVPQNVCAGGWFHVVLMLKKNLRMDVLIQYFLYLGPFFCCRTKVLLSCLTCGAQVGTENLDRT